MTAPHRRPATPGEQFFAALEGGTDPAELVAASDRAAALLVRGAGDGDRAVWAERIAGLGEGAGLALLAELWAQASPQSLAGSLWRLYLLRAFVAGDPLRASREFAAGRPLAEVAGVVAGVADPPGPEQVAQSVGEVLTGVATGEYADVLLRAAAFAHVIASGRAALGESPVESAARLRTLADQLSAAARIELSHGLQ